MIHNRTCTTCTCKFLILRMKRGITIKYLKCRADLNIVEDFGVNGAIGTIVIKWDLILIG